MGLAWVPLKPRADWELAEDCLRVRAQRTVKVSALVGEDCSHELLRDERRCKILQIAATHRNLLSVARTFDLTPNT